MSTTNHASALSGLDDLEQRLRGPDLQEGSPAAQLAISIVLPGVPALRRSPFVALLLSILGIVVPVVGALWAYSNRDDLIGLALDERFLLGVVVVGFIAILARLLALAEVAHAFRRTPGIGGRTAVATAVVLALSIPVMWTAVNANQARGAVGNVFASNDGEPIFTPSTTGSGAGGVGSDGSEAVDAASVKNILLLGGDAGPGRWGLRTDTMILVTVHEASGRTSLVSIPRNLTRLQFPPGSPLAEDFPDGFDDLANAVFPYVSGREDLMEYYGRNGRQAEAVALAEGIGYSLDVAIDDYALVNMQGFLEVIDAIGGVEIEIPEALPMPGTIPGAKRELPDTLGPGVVQLDGTLAIAYVRSRSADSDYQRMGRQRQLLSALGSQVSPTDALRAFGSVTGDLENSMRTSLSAGEFSDLLDRLGDSEGIHESVGLAPPLITPGSPDYPFIQSVVDAVHQAVVTGAQSGFSG